MQKNSARNVETEAKQSSDFTVHKNNTEILVLFYELEAYLKKNSQCMLCSSWIPKIPVIRAYVPGSKRSLMPNVNVTELQYGPYHNISF